MHEWNSGNKKQPDNNGINSLIQWVIIIKYEKITIDHAIYIRFFSDGTVSYLTFSTDDVLNTTNNETKCTELRIVSKKILRLKSKNDL